jgi:hypothetical protein
MILSYSSIPPHPLNERKHWKAFFIYWQLRRYKFTLYKTDIRCRTSQYTFNVPRIVNLPFSNVPQKWAKTMKNLTVATLRHLSLCICNNKVYLFVCLHGDETYNSFNTWCFHKQNY